MNTNSPLNLSDREANLLRTKNPEIIKKYIEYVKSEGQTTLITSQKQKYLMCNTSNVLQYFCEILSEKTQMKQLRPATIAKLITDMNDGATTGNWGTSKSQRKWAIDRLCDLAGKSHSIDQSEIADARSWLTPENDSLTTATMISSNRSLAGSYIIRKFNDTSSTNPPIEETLNNYTVPTLQEQKEHSRKFFPFTVKKVPALTITAIKRKKCATCWMCKRPIYVYEISGTNNTTQQTFSKSISCGEDEHVLPPGWGNIVGVLWGNLADQEKFNVNTDKSLAPSHAWCNQLKNDELFIKLPRSNNNWKFEINYAGITRFKNKGLHWLSSNVGNLKDHDMFYTQVVRSSANPPETDNISFMDNIIKHITTHMTSLITDLNNNMDNKTGSQQQLNITNADRDYTTFMLRTTLCLVYTWVQYITKKSTTISGGGNIIGISLSQSISNRTDTSLNNINNDLLASTIYQYTGATDDKDLKVRSFFESNKMFALNEGLMMCKISYPDDVYFNTLERMANAGTYSYYSNYSNYLLLNKARKNMATIGYTVGLIIYHVHLAPVFINYDFDAGDDYNDNYNTRLLTDTLSRGMSLSYIQNSGSFTDTERYNAQINDAAIRHNEAIVNVSAAEPVPVFGAHPPQQPVTVPVPDEPQPPPPEPAMGAQPPEPVMGAQPPHQPVPVQAPQRQMWPIVPPQRNLYNLPDFLPINQPGGQKIGKKRSAITINGITINSKKHKSKIHRSRKHRSRKHRLIKHRSRKT